METQERLVGLSILKVTDSKGTEHTLSQSPISLLVTFNEKSEVIKYQYSPFPHLAPEEEEKEDGSHE